MNNLIRLYEITINHTSSGNYFSSYELSKNIKAIQQEIDKEIYGLTE